MHALTRALQCATPRAHLGAYRRTDRRGAGASNFGLDRADDELDDCNMGSSSSRGVPFPQIEEERFQLRTVDRLTMSPYHRSWKKFCRLSRSINRSASRSVFSQIVDVPSDLEEIVNVVRLTCATANSEGNSEFCCGQSFVQQVFVIVLCWDTDRLGVNLTQRRLSHPRGVARKVPADVKFFLRFLS